MSRRLIVVFAVVGALAACAPTASAGTKVVVTIDVESNATYRLPDQVDAVCADGSSCGLMEIARLLNERGWSGTFFLNVYEHPLWGQPAMRRIAVRLMNAHQDLGLHTHPDTMYDRSRPEMYEYSLDEQTAIVRDGMILLESWTGLPVVSHRAGAYSGDQNTLLALERNHIPLDSSLFWKYPKSKLNDTGLPRNIPAMRDHVTELPVTAYERQDRPGLFGSVVAPVSSVRKIDADWLIDAREMRAAIDSAVAADLPVVVVFLHSFSFMDERSGGAPAADRHAMEMFRATLDYVASKHLAVVSMRDLATTGVPLLSADRDVVPQIEVNVDLPHYVWRRMKGFETVTLVSGIGAILLMAGAVVVVIRRGKRSHVATTPGEPAAGGVPSR